MVILVDWFVSLKSKRYPGKCQRVVGWIVISSPIQSLRKGLFLAGETRGIVLQWETLGMKVLFHRGQKKGTASQVEQRMKNEECYSDAAEEAK